MKKVCVFLLLLIPILIILTINVSGMIISAEVTIGVETFVLKHLGEEVSDVTIDLTENMSKPYQLIPVYLPRMAQVSGFDWKSDNESVATVNGEGLVTFRDCGFAKVTAVSLDDNRIKASCAFFVEDRVIHSLSFYSYKTGEEIDGSFAMKKYESEQIRLEINPYGALGNECATFSSSDESVVACSKEGVLTALSEGNATVTVRAKDSAGEKTNSFTVRVSGEALVKRAEVCASGNAFDLSPYIVRGEAAGGNVVDLTSVPFGGSKKVSVSSGEERAEITVYKLAFDRELVLDHYAELLLGEWKDGAYIAANKARSFTFADRETRAKIDGVRIASSDPSVIAVRGDAVIGLKDGTATLTFEKDGYHAFTIELTSATPLSFFSLNLVEEDDPIGFMEERVFGTKSYYDGELVNGIRLFPEKVFPEGANKMLFEYYSDSEWASVSEDGFVSFREGAEGKEITVRAKSLFSVSPFTRSYTFKNLVKGVNVGFGFGLNAFDEKSGELPSFVPYEQAIEVNNMADDLALVFQTNVYMPDRETLDGWTRYPYAKIVFVRDIYGNGHKIDGQFYQYDYESHIFTDIQDSMLEGKEEKKGVRVRNLYIQSYAPKTSESQESFKELMTKGGTPIRTFIKKRTDYEVAFDYCVFQYAYQHVTAIGGRISFNGCVFRNTVSAAISIESLHEQPNFVTIRNCVFSNSLSFAVILSNGTFPLPSDEVVRYNALTWEGNNYLYNWKKSDEVRMDIIPEGLMKNDRLDKILKNVNDKLSESARHSFVSSENDALCVKKDGDKYVNLGVLIMPFWCDPKTILNEPRERVEDGLLLKIDLERASYLPLTLYTKNFGDLLKRTLKNMLDLDASCYMITNKSADGVFNTQPGEKYNLNEEMYAKLRG